MTAQENNIGKSFLPLPVTQDTLSVKKKKAWLPDIERAKGLAIMLVVYGHLISDSLPEGNEWYAITNKMVYLFHMPFFMFLSGAILFYHYTKIDTVGEYSRYAIKKIIRLAPAFFIFGSVTLVGKVVASQFIFVDNVPESLFGEWVKMLVYPSSSAAGSLWYIYTLLQLSLVFPFLMALAKGRLYYLAFFSLLFYFVTITPAFMIDHSLKYLVFFCLGALAIQHYDAYTAFIDRNLFLLSALFGSSFLLMYWQVDKQTAKLIIGFCSIPALHALVRTPLFERMTWLTTLGKYCFAIYLLNTITIGLTKGIAFHFTGWGGWLFLMLAPLLMFSGLVVPVLVKKYIFSRIPLLDRITS